MLSRLMRWCSAEGIAPGDVDQAVIERFGAALCQDSFHDNPEDLWRRTVRAWNQAVETVPGWPQLVLAPPAGREAYVLAMEAFPLPFQADAKLWLDRLAGKAGLDVGPVKPLRPATLDKWRFAIRQLASALVLGGRDVTSFAGLADLVTPEAAEAILRFYLTRAGNKASAQTQGLAARLKAIARHHVGVAPEVLDKLRRMASRLTPPLARHDRQEPRRPAPAAGL